MHNIEEYKYCSFMSDASLVKMQGWGGFSVAGEELCMEDLAKSPQKVPIARGLGRSYGDSSLPPKDQPVALNTVRADRILAFDEESGILRAEAGLSLEALHRIFLHRGWTVPVSPGTQFVTLGGMVAADVHGKNHHVDGCIGEHIRSLWVRVASGDVIECNPTKHEDLFYATIGGMGLTGIIFAVELKLKAIPSPWIRFESRRIPNLEAFLEGLEEAAAKWPYTVGWIDCLKKGKHMGRGILIAGQWADAKEAPQKAPKTPKGPSIPFHAPNLLLSRPTIRAFNMLYYGKHIPKKKSGVCSPYSFFYPLDAVRHWNRLYGSMGFTQYQCVIPKAAGREAVQRVMKKLTELGGASFLAVIKDCGAEGRGLLSFPMPGTSIALDLPVRRNTEKLVHALNRCVLEEGGRIYLAKDTFTTREHFAAMEGARLERFRALRDKWDPEGLFRSHQSQRLLDQSPRVHSTPNAQSTSSVEAVKSLSMKAVS